VPGSADETAAEYRPLLFYIAYGMTGSVGDAEDIVQDAFLGMTRARRAGTTIADPKAYLTTAVTRLGINYLRSARVRRETYVGDWLPEPIVVPAGGPGPAEHAELADSLSMAFLVLLEAPEGIVLRYGTFYGPGTGEFLVEMARKRQLPVIGGGTGVWSFIEITDAAAATIAAIEHGTPGIYNVVDDDPAPAAEWLPYLAKVAGGKPPLRVPAWIGRLLAGEFVVAQMTSSRGSSNQKARIELGWVPQYLSWREGFRAWVR
jgi:hypothetical protein